MSILTVYHKNEMNEKLMYGYEAKMTNIVTAVLITSYARGALKLLAS